MEAWMFWLIAAIVFAIIEILTPTFFIMWFSIGSIAAGLASVFFDSFIIPFYVFAITSLLLVIYSRPLTQKFKKTNFLSNTDALIGKIGIVTKEIKNFDDNGRIEILGQSWKASSDDNIEFAVGDKVKILSIDGVTLKVTQIKK